LLLVLVSRYLLSAFAAGGWVVLIQIALFVVVAGLAVRSGRIRRRAAHQAVHGQRADHGHVRGDDQDAPERRRLARLTGQRQ
jgi:hypothetical protein